MEEREEKEEEVRTLGRDFNARTGEERGWGGSEKWEEEGRRLKDRKMNKEKRKL